MSQIGVLGDIPFQVSDAVIHTISNAAWKGSSRYSTHQRHMTHALTEFTGIDPDSFTFDIHLLAVLGVDPMKTLVQIWDYERKGTTLPLVIGRKAYGKYRWTIKSHSCKLTEFDNEGDLMGATVSITLQEYLQGGEKP